MTAYIDNIIIQGTPEEIKEFMELREKPSFGNTDYKLCTTCYSAPCQCVTGNMQYGSYCGRCLNNPCKCKSGIDTDGAFIPDHMYFKT